MPPSANIYPQVSIRKLLFANVYPLMSIRKCLCTERALTVPLIDSQIKIIVEAGHRPEDSLAVRRGLASLRKYLSANVYPLMSVYGTVSARSSYSLMDGDCR